MWHAAAAAAAAPPTVTVAPAAAAAPRVAVQSGRSGPFCPPSHDAFAHLETIAVHAICRGGQCNVVAACAVCATAGAQLAGYLLAWVLALGTRTRTRVSHRCDRKWICINIDSLT